MNHRMVVAAAFSLFALGLSAAFAHGHMHGGGVRFYPAAYYSYYPFYPWYPYAAYPAYPVYPAPPIVIERYRVAQAPQPPQYRYEEREELSQAQVTPPQPRPAQAAAQRADRGRCRDSRAPFVPHRSCGGWPAACKECFGLGH